MSEDYTPTTGAIRSGYAYYAPDRDVVEMALTFDRWLTAHDAEIRTAALEEAADEVTNILRRAYGANTVEQRYFRNWHAEWLRARARKGGAR